MGPVLMRREELLPRNESRSGTEGSIVTVATLSNGLLEAPSQNQNNPECPQRTDTTNGSDNEISQPVFQENAAPRSSDLSRPISVSLIDGDLSNNAAIPSPAISSHNVLPDPQSVSRMDTPVSSLTEPTNQPSSCVIRRLVLDLPPTDYHYSYDRMPQTIPSSTPTQSISNSTLLSTHKSRTSEEPEDIEQDSSNEDSRPAGDVENASSTIATTNTRIARRFSISSSSSRGVSNSDTTDSGADIGTR